MGDGIWFEFDIDSSVDISWEVASGDLCWNRSSVQLGLDKTQSAFL